MVDQLEQGQGFTEPIVWNFLNPRSSIAHPMDYWMPLGIILYYCSRLIWGVSGEIWLNIFIWSSLSLAVYFQVKKHTGSRFSSFFAFFLMLGCGRNLFYLLTTDNIAFYAAIGFLLFSNLHKAEDCWLKIAFVSALAALMRIEGTLVAAFACFFVFYRCRRYRVLALVIIAILVFISPWMIRNFLVLGKLWTSNLKALLIVNYNDIFCSDFSGSLENFISQGWKQILEQRLVGFWASLLNLLLIPGMFLFCVLWLPGLKRVWNEQGRGPVGLLLLMLAFCALIVPLQADRGTAMHISALFLPFFAMISGIGFDEIKNKMEKNKSLFILVAGLLFFWSGWATWYSTRQMIRVQNEINAPYLELKRLVPEISEKTAVSVSPIRVFIESGAKGVMFSASTKIAANKLADKFGCNLIILDNRAKFTDWRTPAGFEKIASTSHLLIFQRIRSDL